MTKKLLGLCILLLLGLLFPALAHAQYNPVAGWCEDGNKVATISGVNSTNKLMASYSACTVTVVVHGGSAATIYSDAAGTPLANPFTAASNGQWLFFAASGLYDVTISGGTPALPAPVTFESQLAGSGTGAVTSFSSGDLSPLFTTSVADPTSTPALSFALSSAAANKVFGNCTALSATPSYCSLTAAMLAAPGSDTNIMYNSSGAFAGSDFLTWNNSTKTLAVNATAGNPVVRLLSDSGAGKLLFSTGSYPFIKDNTGSGWSFTSQDAQNMIFGTASDPQSFVLGGDASGLTHGSAQLGIGSAPGIFYLNDGTSMAGIFQGPLLMAGNASPEGIRTARVSSLYMRSDGSLGTSLYVKESGTGNTGWVPLTCLAGSDCTASNFYTGNGSVSSPSYSFTNATSTGFYWTGTQACLSRAGASQWCTNGGPGLTSSGTLCLTVATACFGFHTWPTTLEPSIEVTSSGAIALGLPRVAGNVNCAGCTSAEKGFTYFNTSTNIPRYWNGSALMDYGAPVYNATGTLQTASHVVIGSCTLGTDCAVTLTGASVFTSSSSYSCTATDVTGTNAIAAAYASGSSFTLTGTGTDVLRYICAGN